MTYKEVYSQETVDKIEELVEETYCLEDIIEFIDENSEENFRDYYEDYVSIGENYSYGAVDAFIEEFGLESLTSDAFQDAYYGHYESKADFAEQYVSDCYGVDFPSFIEVDWEATFENLGYAFTETGYVFNTQF